MSLALTDNALEVLKRRYLIKDHEGNPVETPEDMFRRVADSVAQADLNYNPNADIASTSEKFFKMMSELRFLPNSPTLMNAGRPLGQLSACFVLPIEDSMEGIFETIKQAALIHKSGGGTGFSFSRLRPAGSSVRSTGGVASGPVSFMKVFNTATEAVKQGGTRRGANMGILRVDHPDILEFIDCKKNNLDINNFNISVGITEEFMKAVEEGTDYNLVEPHGSETIGSLNARMVFEKIVENAWRNGEPGIIFLDRLNNSNVVPSEGEIEATNPCGEQPLLPFESCNLGSINLSKMLRKTERGFVIDSELLGRTIYDAVHFLDNVIDVNTYPLEIIAETTQKTRKIGLGVMGFADMLLALDIPYDSDTAVTLAEKIMEFINKVGHEASERLAQIRSPFPLFYESIYRDGNPLRNATVTTIAPTGTISIIANSSSGVEPVFAFAYVRNVMDGTRLVEINPILKTKLEEEGILSDALMDEIARVGSIAEIAEIPEKIRKTFRCAHDISPEFHIRVQAAFQKHTDNAVSKTVNFSRDATMEDVYKTYILAYRLGCKGVTIYRDGSRENQVLSVGTEEDIKKEEVLSDGELPGNFGSIVPRPRPEVTKGFTERVRTGCGNLYITVNYDKHGICEVFTSTGKGGGCPSQSESTARLVSIALRSGISVDEIYAQLKGIRCPSTVRVQGLNCTSCPDAIAKVIRKVSKFQQGQAPDVKSENSIKYQDKPSLSEEIKKKLNDKDFSSKAPFEKKVISKKPEHIETPKPFDFSYSEHLKKDIKLKKPVGLNSDESKNEAGGNFPNDFGHDEPAFSRRLCPDCSSFLEHEGGCVVCRNCGYSKCG